MAMNDYSDKFKADTVTPYEFEHKATHKSIAADLGINLDRIASMVAVLPLSFSPTRTYRSEDRADTLPTRDFSETWDT